MSCYLLRSVYIAIVGLVIPSSGIALAAGRVQEIPATWHAKDLRRVAVASTQASSMVESETGQYTSARAVDGHRGTKWVADKKPSPASPQWITLELFGTQDVCAVAVFGEQVDNDGIRDAQIQVVRAETDQFTTVATIENAKSARWLATFDPVKTKALRVLITRSGGPSAHTDVYEIEVFGRPLPVAELKGHAVERLNGCALRWKDVTAAVEKLGLKKNSQLAALCRAVDSLEAQYRQSAEQLARWEGLNEFDRSLLAAELERIEIQMYRLAQGLPTGAAVCSDRVRDLNTARQRGIDVATGEKASVFRDGGKVHLGNNRVDVVLDEVEGVWEATWLGQVDAAVRRVHFAVEADGRKLAPQAVKAETLPFADATGSGMELCQRWGGQIEVQRRIRVYHGRPAVVVSAQIANRSGRDVTLGLATMLELSDSDRGWWHLGDLMQAPAAVGYAGASPPCRPTPDEESPSESVSQYTSGELLALAPRESKGALAIGALSARQGSPSVHARFQTGQGGVSLAAVSQLRTRLLPAGVTVTLDPVWLSVEENRYDALEHYGDAVAASSPQPVRTEANALWCSWYPIRMGINEEIVLTHAAIAAKHFKPLGLDVIQLDHGWQRGDLCGDWTANERFPHGLRWLSEQLQSRYGMKLGLWIAPTQVAFTSQLFQDHPRWMLQDAQGKPRATGRWFWVPKPEMAVLDASHPPVEQWLEQTFARLSSEGAVYYKIDFIAGSPALDRAMAAIRRGAGPGAWIRYCQTPALLSAGLASSAYIGADTGDAGLHNWIELLRGNAPLLAASYWANGRLYRREVCDMSVGMKAGVEEARFRLALMTLSGCSISFSDDFRPLQLPRIRMMQQCLPPGNPAARPLDLFERKLPLLWHMHCRNRSGEWDVVGVFNFEDQRQEQAVELSSLGLPVDAKCAVFEFWEEKFLGVHTGRVTLSLAPRTARVLLVRRVTDRPQVIATNMHLLGGYHEIKRLAWDDNRLVLSGTYQRAPGLEGKAYLYVPDHFRPLSRLPLGKGPTGPAPAGKNLWVQEVQFTQPQIDWEIPFERVSE